MEIKSQRKATNGLIIARTNPDGSHMSRYLSREVELGHSLRLRRGIYTDAAAWSGAPPWEKHRMSTVATALVHPTAVFCRETALALYSIPLLRSPQQVQIRTWDKSRVGVQRTGGGHAVKRIEPALPPGQSRDALRRLIRQGQYTMPSRRLPAETFPDVIGPPGGYLVDPLELALIDTASRLPFADAIVILDAALAGSCLQRAVSREQVAAWECWLPSRRKRSLWQRAMDFADPRSESPGESFSRVRIHELGFAPPSLQRTLRLEGKDYRLDFEWKDLGIVGEFDGRVKYFDAEGLTGADAASAVYQEKIREDVIRQSGRTVVRWGWDALKDLAILERLLQRAGVPKI